jgi:hypothetical protein
MISPPEPETQPKRRGRSWALVLSFVSAVAASAYLAWTPTYVTQTSTVEITTGGQRVTASSTARRTLSEVNGPTVYVAVAIPMLLAALPLLFRRPGARRASVRASALLLLAFVLLGGFSIGMFYLPSAVAMGLAALDRRY